MKHHKFFNSMALASFFFVLFSFSSLALAQDEWQYWNAFQLKAKLSDDFTLGLKNEIRMFDDFNELGLVNFDLGIYWNASKYLVLSPHFTYEHENKTSGSHSNENRWYPEATLKYNWKKISLSSRNRMEYRNKNTTDSWRYRNNFMIAYPLPFEKMNINIYASEELFWEVSDSSFNQNRIKMGTSIRLQEHVDLSLYYLLKSSRVGSDWNEAHVLGTGLTVSV